jgi:hypothetical protein
MTLIPPLASMTVGWEGGWNLGIAGAAAGAAAGAVMGWLFNRWIMPEYDRRRARESAIRPAGSTDEPESNGSMAEPCAELLICPTCAAPLREKGTLFCKRCGTVSWSDTVGILVVGLFFIGLGALVSLGSYFIASSVASWLVYVLGAGIMALCAAFCVAILTDIGRARQLASSWRRNRSNGNSDG